MTRSETLQQVRQLIQAISEYCSERHPLYQEVDNNWEKSAENLLHYLGLRQFDLRELQAQLANLGLSSLGRSEGHTLKNLKAVENYLSHQTQSENINSMLPTNSLSKGRSQANLEKNTVALFGQQETKPIMVTMATEAASTPEHIFNLSQHGMTCVRINTAHDSPDEWQQMIQFTREAASKQNKDIRVSLDLAGPKIRTGDIESVGKYLHLHPVRDFSGKILSPHKAVIKSKITRPFLASSMPIIAVDNEFLQLIKVNDTISFKDCRGKKRQFTVTGVEQGEVFIECEQSAYLGVDIELKLYRRQSDGQTEIQGTGLIVDLPEIVTHIKVYPGAMIDLIPPNKIGHAEAGQNGRPEIPCTNALAFECIKVGDPIIFDDGKIQGVARDVSPGVILVEILHCASRGAKLKSEKGINLPKTQIPTEALTGSDKKALEQFGHQVDLVSLSFVRTPEDIDAFYHELDRLKLDNLGVVLKIETKSAFDYLPKILLTAMKRSKVGVMIARGDLAAEIGFERMSEVQEEMLWICEAANVPVIWATQVLENLVKKGTPSRSEVSDVSIASRADAIMLNKGPYLCEALAFIEHVMDRMKAHMDKKQHLLRKLSISTRL